MLSGFLWGVSLGLGYFWLAAPRARRVGKFTEEEIAEEYAETVTGRPRRTEWLGPGYTFKKSKSGVYSTPESRRKNREAQQRYLERHPRVPKPRKPHTDPAVLAKRRSERKKERLARLKRENPAEYARRLQKERERKLTKGSRWQQIKSNPTLYAKVLEQQRRYTANWRAKKK
jgi:hypothetical protein